MIFPLGDEVIRKIIALKINQIRDRFKEHYKAAFTYDDAVMTAIAGRCKEVESGARNVDHILSGTMLPEMSKEVLVRMAEGKPVGRAHVGVDAEGKFVYDLA